MVRTHTSSVCTVASWTKVLDIGVTDNLEARLYQHRNAGDQTFAGHYRTHRLVYVEDDSRIDDAIVREKQRKGWRREKKVALIERQNAGWRDLSDSWD